MFIFARCLRSSAAVTPAKDELDIIQVTTVFIIRKNRENNGTEKIGLVTPTLDLWYTLYPADLEEVGKSLTRRHAFPPSISWFIWRDFFFQKFVWLQVWICQIINIYNTGPGGGPTKIVKNVIAFEM